MAKQLKLSAAPRSASGRKISKQLRAEKRVPAVIYGGHEEPENLSIAHRDLEILLGHAASEHLLVDLEISDPTGVRNRAALIQSVQHDPLSTKIVHVDLLGVRMDETIVSSVPLEPVGESIGVKTYGGLLEVLLRELEVECLPKDLPEILHFDVSNLNIDESLHVSDLVLPEGVTAVTDAEVTVAHVTEPTVAAEPVASETPAAPEVIKEKKPEAEAKK